MAKTTTKTWFENCGGWSPRHNLDELRTGLDDGLLNEQDEYGMTALSLAVSSGWKEGVDELLRAGADVGLRYHRTGETALHLAVQSQNQIIIAALIAGGANPDAANHWGLTPREAAGIFEFAPVFENVPLQEVELPPPLIQNAEHLAEHYHPEFEIPDRDERETLQPGQAVNLYVYGPKAEHKQDVVRVRISARREVPQGVRYVAVVETPLDKVHLPPDTKEVEFGPENVATVYVPQAKKWRKLFKFF